MTIVWTNGCFDLLHPSHIDLLAYCKMKCPNGLFIVGIDTDERVKQLKGNDRPFLKLKYRIKMLEAIRYIDIIKPFSTKEELENLIKEIEPDIMVVGEDYQGKEVIGSQYVKKLEFFKRDPNFSTTNILKGIKPE